MVIAVKQRTKVLITGMTDKNFTGRLRSEDILCRSWIDVQRVSASNLVKGNLGKKSVVLGVDSDSFGPGNEAGCS